ncbi:MAG TPA: MgtC/SapB family protein [Thermoanaerobaculia bacterium]|nr:MgtC/SapB family protein [Thermoanaerobaculia bacterium]
MRLGTATLIAGGIGLDRELRHKPAGLKTHALVGLGSSLIVVVAAALSNMASPDTAAMSRVIQGLIAGVGFLGGGAILKSGDEIVQGLTTAASIWLVASLGVACGAGQWTVALIGFAIALLVLVGGNAAEKFVIRRHREED